MTIPRASTSLLANAALVGAWVLVHASAIGWLGSRFAGAPVHAAILLGAALLVHRGARPKDASDALAALCRAPRMSAAPVALTLGSAIALTLCERRFGTTTLSALFLGAGAYGLAGLFVDAARFRRALPAALLLICLLPFGEQADSYFGFLARTASARVVGSLLTTMGHPALPVETILVLENGIAHIDIPCSGARSLWTGALVFLAGTCLLERRPGLRWALVGVTHMALLLTENVARIAAIVLVAVVLDRPHLAEIVHAPLGVLGFALSCATTLFLLQRFVPPAGAAPADAPLPSWPRRSGASSTTTTALTGALLALALLRAPPALPATTAPLHLDLGPTVAARALPLTTAESDLFRRWGGSAAKVHFEHAGVSGSLLVVQSRSFHAHHPPEVCLATSGVHVDHLREVALDGADEVRVADADGGRRTAIYWYQSPTRVSADIVARVWSGITDSDDRWAQVSLIVDAPLDVASPEGRSLVATIKAAVAGILAEESR